MDTRKKSQKPNEKDTGKNLLGKRHEDDKPTTDKDQRNAFNKKDMADEDDDDRNNPEKKIEINDNPKETERKMPRMNN